MFVISARTPTKYPVMIKKHGTAIEANNRIGVLKTAGNGACISTTKNAKIALRQSRPETLVSLSGKPS